MALATLVLGIGGFHSAATFRHVEFLWEVSLGGVFSS